MNRWFNFIFFLCLALIAFAVFFVNAQGWEPYVDPSQVALLPPSTTPPSSNAQDTSVAVPASASVASSLASSLEKRLHGCKFIAEVVSVPNKYVATSVDISGFPNFQHFLFIAKDGENVVTSTVFDFFQADILGKSGAWRAMVDNVSPKSNKENTNAKRLLPQAESPPPYSYGTNTLEVVHGVNGNGKSDHLLRFQVGPGYATDPFVGVTDDATAVHEIYAASGRVEENGVNNIVLYIDSHTGNSYQPLGWSFDNFGLHPNLKKKNKNPPIVSNKTVQLYSC